MKRNGAQRFIESNGTLSEPDTFRLAKKIQSTRGWVSFIGTMMIILGCFTGLLLSILGVVLTIMGGWTGILLIAMGLAAAVIAICLGVLLSRAGRGAKIYLERANQIGALTYHEKLRRYFSFRGVLAIIGLCLLGIGVIGLIVSLFTTGFNWSF
ncbi:hypothetical protein GF359_07595 [candidate division WOR-3 bacterium]|uniref:DUF5362 domain-containing protein n=1 Tax=candidate division WOR-3 bacterium TaxID=2052148 RepID=A0A9D5KAB2_UNCW3|nr:hypothetical protein [candidate division WOR-3 bacterium]MBD3365064.1 hypothetical protein [candidate division WOR-3 bacterium]